MSNVETPGDQGCECALLRLRRHRGGEVPEQRDPRRAGVEPLRMRADHIALDTTSAAFVHGAETVDEKVVADVVPPVPLHVVDLDATYDRRRLCAGVRVRAGRVVNDGESYRRRERGPGPDDLLVRSPRGASDDGRSSRLCEGAR